MGLNTRIKAAVSRAIELADDVRTQVTYRRIALGPYDPVSDTRAETITEYPLLTAVVGLSDAEVDYWPADIVTQKILIAANDLPIVPEVTDNVTINGLRWEVKRVKTTPGGSLYVVFIQEA